MCIGLKVKEVMMSERKAKYLHMLRACLLSQFRRIQLLVTPWTVVHQAPLSMGFSRQEYWSELLFPIPGDLPHPGINQGLLHWQVGSLALAPPGKPVCLQQWFSTQGELASQKICGISWRHFWLS